MQAFGDVVVSLEAFPRLGGAASYVGFSVQAAREAGMNVALAAPKGSTNAQIELNCSHPQSLLNLWQASRQLEKIQASCVYLAEAAALRAALWNWNWTKKQRIRLILHGSETLELARSHRFHELLKKAVRIYVLSRFVAELVLGVEPTVKNKLVITGAAPSPRLTYFEGLKEPFKLITTARLHPRKGQHVILEAMLNGELDGFTYDMIGPARNGTYTRKIKQLVEKINHPRPNPPAPHIISSRSRGTTSPEASQSPGSSVQGVGGHKTSATLHGQLDDSKLSLLYAQSSIFVLPAEDLGEKTYSKRVEGYGLALLDAASMGCIVVAYDCGGISEAVQHCKTGFLVPPGDRTALIDTIKQIARDDKLRLEMSQNAINWANSKTWRDVAERLFAN